MQFKKTFPNEDVNFQTERANGKTDTLWLIVRHIVVELLNFEEREYLLFNQAESSNHFKKKVNTDIRLFFKYHFISGEVSVQFKVLKE